MSEPNFNEIFARGQENTAFAQYFVGCSYLNMLSISYSKCEKPWSN